MESRLSADPNRKAPTRVAIREWASGSSRLVLEWLILEFDAGEYDTIEWWLSFVWLLEEQHHPWWWQWKRSRLLKCDGRVRPCWCLRVGWASISCYDHVVWIQGLCFQGCFLVEMSCSPSTVSTTAAAAAAAAAACKISSTAHQASTQQHHLRIWYSASPDLSGSRKKVVYVATTYIFNLRHQ